MDRLTSLMLFVGVSLLLAVASSAQEAGLRVDVNTVTNRVTPYMTGACIEDVNHEIYGGIYSQMIFGESFEEPPPTAPPPGFTAYGGMWRVDDGVLYAPAGDGPKLVADSVEVSSGEVSVDLRLPDDAPGNSGMILKVKDPGTGADDFIGYELSVESHRNVVVLGRHRNNWEHIQDVPFDIPAGEWITLAARVTETGLDVFVNNQLVLSYEDRDHPLTHGGVGLRTWQREAHFRNLRVTTGDQVRTLPFKNPPPQRTDNVSGMWRPLRRGTAEGNFRLPSYTPFAGQQSQCIRFAEGEGEFGIENQGLNRWGMNFVADKPYEGYIWARADEPTEVYVALESADGERVHAERKLPVSAGDWQRLEFQLTPATGDTSGRFAIKLKQPGSVCVGHAFLQPAEWGRFKGLPVRKDVAEGLIAGGFTVLRMGGLMANAPGYRWKNMLGPRDRRPPYKGYWYPYSTNGWGVIEFLDFCEAAGFLAIPDFNMDETPQDMADFVQYVNGSADTPWGRRRAEGGHPEPYGLEFLQLGNEEAVDEEYWQKFKPLAEAIWKEDSQITVIVGDFEYKQPITDPHDFDGAPRIRSLAAHKKILDLAKTHGRKVWFDVHIWNHNPRDPEQPLAALPTVVEWLAKLSPGADFKICVLEENSVNHAVRRAIAHGRTINGLMRMGDQVRIVCAANALQPYQQNDNGWDQGLLFLSPSQVWGQPPYYVTQMIAENYQPLCLKTDVNSPEDALDAVALKSEDGRILTLQVVNLEDRPVRTRIEIDGFEHQRPQVKATRLSGELDAVNTPEHPRRIVPQVVDHGFAADGKEEGVFHTTLPAHSFTILRLDARESTP